MAAKGGGRLGALSAVVFTSLVAPVLVRYAERQLDGHESHSVHRTVAPVPVTALPRVGTDGSRGQIVAPVVHLGTPEPLHQPPAAPAPGAVQVIVQASGKTADEALRNALDAALSRAVAARVDADTWARRGPALCAIALRNRPALLRAWRVLGSRTERKLFGTVVHREVAVDVDGEALARLLSEGPSVATPAAR